MLGDGDALDGEEFLGVGGAVTGDEIGAEIGDGLGVFETDDGEFDARRSRACGNFGRSGTCPRAVLGPVELAALARLAASRFSEMGFLDFGISEPPL